jgi:hypothetical protein
LDEWPPKDPDYREQLEKYKLRKLDYNSFKKEPDFDERGLPFITNN